MIDCAEYIDFLMKRFDFFAGVPDSLLKHWCACLKDKMPGHRNIVAANEGHAVALAAGHYLATSHPAVVYMQNSGLGNAVNPFVSLCDPLVFGIPLLAFIGWRGEPGVKDEPQHVKQGAVTLPLLDAMQIRYVQHPDDFTAARAEIEEALRYMKAENAPFAFIVKKNVFAPYESRTKDASWGTMRREEAIKAILDVLIEDDVIVATTGMISRELFELREKRNSSHDHDFLCVGSMGHASQIAAAIALEKKPRRVICLDGDGALLMHMGGLAVIGTLPVPNLVHIVLNNAAHDSVGGQPTVARHVDLCAIALACGYKRALKAEDKEFLRNVELREGPIFIEVPVHKGHRPDLGRPSLPPQENKFFFMRELSHVK